MVTRKSIKPGEIRGSVRNQESQGKTPYPALEAAMHAAEQAVRNTITLRMPEEQEVPFGYYIDYHDRERHAGTKLLLLKYVMAVVYPIALSDCPIAKDRVPLLKQLFGQCFFELSSGQLEGINGKVVFAAQDAFVRAQEQQRQASTKGRA